MRKIPYKAPKLSSLVCPYFRPSLLCPYFRASLLCPYFRQSELRTPFDSTQYQWLKYGHITDTNVSVCVRMSVVSVFQSYRLMHSYFTLKLNIFILIELLSPMHIAWKFTQNVAFLFFQFWHFLPIFCPFKTDLSGNTVWQPGDLVPGVFSLQFGARDLVPTREI